MLPNRYSFTSVLLFFGFLLLCPTTGVAGDLYFDVNVGAAFLNTPDHQFFCQRQEGAPFARLANLPTDDGQGWGTALGGKVGYILDRALLNADGSRLEFQGFFLDQDGATRAEFPDGGAGERYGWVELDGSNGFGTLDGRSLVTSVHRDNDFDGYDLLLHQDHRLDANRMLTFYGGFSAYHLYQDTIAIGGDLPGGTTVRLEEALGADYIGGKMGMRGIRKLGDRWSITVGGDLGFYGVQSSYRGMYEDSAENIHGRTLSDSRFSLGATGELEVTRHLTDACFLSFHSSLHHLHYAPRIGYGTIGSPTPPNGFPVMESGDLTSVMLRLSLTMFR